MVPLELWGRGDQPTHWQKQNVRNWQLLHDLSQQPIGENEIIFPQRCDIWVNHNYKIIYLRLYKSGSKLGYMPHGICTLES